MRLLFLLLLVVLAIGALLVMPLVFLWESGRDGPPRALLVVAIILSLAAYSQMPGAEPWPQDASQLKQISGKVTKAQSISQGGSSWYELELTGPEQHLSVAEKWGLTDDHVRGVIGREITAGCYERPEHACQTVSLSSDGNVLVSYEEVLREWRATNEWWRTACMWTFGLAGILATLGLGWLVAVRNG